MDEMILGTIAGAGGLFVGLALGKYSSATNQAMLMRNLFKKDYIILSFVDNEISLEDEHIVERKEDVIEYKDYAWICKGAKFYRRISADETSEKGARLSYRNGVPILYVDKKDCIPVEVGSVRTTKVSAQSINSGLNAWMLNMAKKRLTMLFKNLDNKLLIAIILIIVGIAVTYFFNNGTHEVCQKAFDLLNHTG